MLIIKVDLENGKTVPDKGIHTYVSSMIADYKHWQKFGPRAITTNVGSELLVLAFQLAVRRGEIESYEVRFCVDKKMLMVDEFQCDSLQQEILLNLL